MNEISGIRVLFAGEYWPGANSLYIARAFEHCGAVVRWVNDSGFSPTWSTLSGRALHRLLFPFTCMEWNKHFLNEFNNFQPDLVYITNAPYLAQSTVDFIHQKSIPVMCFYHDPPWRNRRLNRFAENVSRFDLIVSTRHWHKAEFEASGAKQVAIVRFGYDPLVHRPLTISSRAYDDYHSDITFVGTNRPKRAQELTALVSEDFSHSLNIWGNYWNRLPSASPLPSYWQKRVVFEQEIPIIYAASKVALHWVNWEPEGSDEAQRKGDQHNSRTFQIPACGGAIMITQRTDEHQQFFEEDVEAVFFDDIKELRDKLDYWLDPCRDQARLEMAHAARERCLKEDYTYVPVVRRFLDHFGLTHV